MLVSFDYDGVLVDTLTTEAVADWLQVPSQLTDPFCERVTQLFSEHPSRPPFFPGMEQVLIQTAERHSVAIISSNSKSAITRNLERAGLSQTVALIYDRHEPGSKAEKITRALTKYGLAPALGWMVGDAASDILAGRSAGVRTVGVTWGYQLRAKLLTARPECIVDTPAELLSLLLNE